MARKLDPAAEAFLQRLRSRSGEQSAERKITKRRRAFRRAAAVIPDFDPVALRPAGARGARGEAAFDLHQDSLWTAGASRWQLKPEVRRNALKTITNRSQLLRALRAGREAGNPKLVATMIEYVQGKARPLDRQDTEQLAISLKAVQQLSELEIPDLSGLPTVGEVHRALERAYLFEPFSRLVGDHFDGREKELKRLRSFVGVLPPSSRLEAVRRQLEAWLKLMDTAPLLLHGPGGIGKSTLVAKFLLEHIKLPPAIRIPFVYLDFQRPNLVGDEPRTLLIEAARQLAIQYQETSPGFGESALGTADRGAGAESWSRAVAQFGKTLKQAVLTARGELKHETGSLPPWLVVLDSFEEVQYRSSSNLLRLWQALGELQEAYPKLRLVVSGRSPVENIVVAGRKAEELELGDFDRPAARAFLRLQGVGDPQATAALVDQVGGNPLSLLLAAEVARREKVASEGVRDLQTKKLWFLDAGEAVIQGQLYRRILAHVHDAEVRKIAHPGLVLRRLSPEVIQDVLAEPCGLEVTDRSHAQNLFDELRKEAALVSLGADGALYHLPAVRRVMLRLLEKDKPKIVAKIEQRAVTFYRHRKGPTDRAEEIYHRLRLGYDLSQVEDRWIDDVAPLLERSFEELPKPAQVYLAPRLGRRVSQELRKLADLESWEQLTAETADELLQAGAAEKALKLLRQRPDRTSGSPLWLLEATALGRLGQTDEASEVIAKGLMAAGQAGEVTTRLALLVPAANIARQEGRLSVADSHLAEAEELAARLGQDSERLAILLQRAELHRQMLDEPDRAAAVREQIVDVFLALPTGVLTVSPDTVRQVLRVTGAASPEVLARAARLVPIDWQYSAWSDRLAGELARLYVSSPVLARWLRLFVPRGERSPKHADVSRLLLKELATQHRLEEMIRRIAQLGEKATPVLAALAAVIAGTTDSVPSSEE